MNIIQQTLRAALFLILVLRPQGLFGTRLRERI